MATRYRIFAYSRHLNQKQQLMDLQNDALLENQGYAQQHAQSYAQRLNQDFFMHTNDWAPSVEGYEHVSSEADTIQTLIYNNQ